MDVIETVVITGASRGIGEATARRLAAPGRRLLLLARSTDSLERICDDLRDEGAEAEFIEADLSSVELATEAADQIADRVDRVDVLVLNAGMSNDTLFEQSTLDKITYELGVNYLAPVTLLHRLLPQLKEARGHAIVVGSLTALLPFPSNVTYAASKAALLALVKSLRVEMQDSGVHFGIVLPGMTDTQLTDGKNAVVPKASPADVAESIGECIEQRKGLLIPGRTNKLAAAFFQQFPELTEKLVGPIKKKLFPGFDGYPTS